jgi:Ca2+-binding RTX toxin-like protein
MNSPRTPRLGVAVVAATGLLVAGVGVSPAQTTPSQRTQAGMCAGLPATITGSPLVTKLVGTAGDDVIVTGGARNVIARSGDDTVCITGRTKRVDTRAGRDHVVSDDHRVETYVLLGGGADTFMGGARRDRIYSGPGADRVETGAGDDTYDGGGSGSSPGEDPLVHLGAGDDYAQNVGPNPGSILDGGPGLNWLSMVCCDEDAELDWLVSNVTETAVAGGTQQIQWHRFRGFRFGEWNLSGTVEFEGTDAAERVFAGGVFGSPRIAGLHLGGGDDELTFSRASGPVDAGGGRDQVRLVGFADPRAPAAWASEVRVDLRRQRVWVEGAGSSFRGVEDVEVSDFVRAVLEGDRRRNHFVVGNACLVKLRGRPGADVLRSRTNSKRCPGFVESRREVRAFGGRGHDILTGRWTRDRLVGGRGFDRADGRGDIDVCIAETRRRCER